MADLQTVSVRKGQFDVQVRSAGSGPPLVFLHGIDGLTSWPTWLETLSASHRVVAPVLPGYGESSGLENLYDFLDLTIYHQELFEALDIERPSIIGHSLGGAIAAEIAAICPGSVDKLVLVSAMGLWDDENPVADIFATTDQDLRELTWHDLDGAVANGLAPVAQSDEKKMAAVLDRAKSLSTAGRFMWPIPDKGLSKRIHRIKAPTLLIWGDDDKIVPPVYGKMFQERIAGSKLVIVPSAGHSPMLEQPDAFVKAVGEFLG